MGLLVECPRCKVTVQCDLNQGHMWFVCPHCQWQFGVSQAGVPSPEATPLATVVEPPAPPEPPPPLVTPLPVGTFVSPLPQNFEDEEFPVELVGPPAPRTIRYRRKQSPWPLVAIPLGLLGLVVLIAIVARDVEQAPVERVVRGKVRKTIVVPAPHVRRPNRSPSRQPGDAPEPNETTELEEPSEETPPSEPSSVEPEPEPVAPTRRLIARLDESGGQCEGFRFLPEGEPQYQQLQNFALQLAYAKGVLDEGEAGEIDPNDRKALTERSAHWLQTMKTLMVQAAEGDPRRLTRINALVAPALEKVTSSDRVTSQIVFFGCLFAGGDSKHRPILKANRKQLYFSVAANADLDRSDAYRIYFVEILGSPSGKRTDSPGGGFIRVATASLVYSFVPFGARD